MNEDRFLDEFPPAESQPSPEQTPPPEASEDKSRWLAIWEGLSQAGLGEMSVRLGTHALVVVLILFMAWGLRSFYNASAAPGSTALFASSPLSAGARQAALVADPAAATAFAAEPLPALPPFDPQFGLDLGVVRQASMHTDVPSRPRTDVITYTVETGDTLFAIADKFGLQPETLLWGNQFVLGDNPHNLRPGQVLNILPVDGTYHKWSQGDGLNGVAKFFGVAPEDIISFPGNGLSPETIGDYANPNIEAGKWLVVPGGRREFVSWSAPSIPLDNPKVASVLGPGACEGTLSGAIGYGSFIWPANSHFLSGFDYNTRTNHLGIDVDGEMGDPLYASDNGVVVYAGWNNWGYGNMVVINHGNGWQTLYAHMENYYVGCGASVGQGAVIGTVGSTGNSTGSHLHFEMMYNGGKVNPHDYLP